jgi:hypothetical protein
MRDEEFARFLRDLWTSLLVYLTLFGVLLIFLGIGLASWVSALRERERKRAELEKSRRLSS